MSYDIIVKNCVIVIHKKAIKDYIQSVYINLITCANYKLNQ